MRIIEVNRSGRSYGLAVAEAPRPKPGRGEALIQVVGVGVNNADLLQAQGLYAPPYGASPILGLEVSGTVVAPELEGRNFMKACLSALYWRVAAIASTSWLMKAAVCRCQKA